METKETYPFILKVSEISPHTPECLRVVLMQTGDTTFLLTLEGFKNLGDTEMQALSPAKKITDYTQALAQFDFLINSLQTVWRS